MWCFGLDCAHHSLGQIQDEIHSAQLLVSERIVTHSGTAKKSKLQTFAPYPDHGLHQNLEFDQDPDPHSESKSDSSGSVTPTVSLAPDSTSTATELGLGFGGSTGLNKVKSLDSGFGFVGESKRE